MYQPVIGLEIHTQLKTNSKMFCSCHAEYFQKEPNSNVCPVCMGLPGALPVPNEEAVRKVIKLALALNCSINQRTKFDRKNYFYPDLAKGYQISQFDIPFGFEGYTEIEIGDVTKKIRIQRVHLEEDTGKSFHEGENETLIDYNKSGIPLAEIVTYPDFESTAEVTAFAKRLRQIVRYIEVSDAEMQKGQMRFELNISVRKVQGSGFRDQDKNSPAREGGRGSDLPLPNYKIEVKNIGSISVLEKVVNFEIKRQSELLEQGVVLKQETRGLKDMSGETLFQRSKESADDYRYFPEPDIPPIVISDEMVSEIKNLIPELPAERVKRYKEMGLNGEQIDIFVEDIERGNYYDAALSNVETNEIVVETGLKPVSTEIKTLLANLINTDLTGLLSADGKEFSAEIFPINDLGYVATLINDKKINRNVAKSIIEEVYKTKKSAEVIVNEKGLLNSMDDSEIDKYIADVIAANAKVVEDIKKNPNAVKFLVGQVMRLSKGKADANDVEKKILERI